MYMKRHQRRTDQEWMSLINECRTSGLSDKQWCEEHHIHPSNFYYQIRRLRENACEIPDRQPHTFCTKQEVVPIELGLQSLCGQADSETGYADTGTAIIMNYCGIRLEIVNGASGSTICETLMVLQKLC